MVRVPAQLGQAQAKLGGPRAWAEFNQIRSGWPDSSRNRPMAADADRISGVLALAGAPAVRKALIASVASSGGPSPTRTARRGVTPTLSDVESTEKNMSVHLVRWIGVGAHDRSEVLERALVRQLALANGYPRHGTPRGISVSGFHCPPESEANGFREAPKIGSVAKMIEQMPMRPFPWRPSRYASWNPMFFFATWPNPGHLRPARGLGRARS